MLSRPLKFKYISTSFAYIRIAIQCDSYSQLLENYCAQAQKKNLTAYFTSISHILTDDRCACFKKE